MADPPLIRDPVRRALVIVAVWTGIALFFCAQDAVSAYTRGRPPEGWVLRFELIYWWVWIPLTPPALAAARRFRISHESWPKTVALHTMFALLVGITHEAMLFAIRYAGQGVDLISAPGTEVSFAASWPRMPVMVLTAFYKYWALIGIYYAFDYANKSRAKELAAAELSAKLAEAELRALRMQLQPHFLFNTLHAISMLNLSDVDAANRMLVRLSDLLRLSLDNAGRATVPLRVELSFLEKYLEIQRIRFADRLTVFYDIDPVCLDVEVPHFILQPLVENALEHGVREGALAELSISATCHDSGLTVRICDNGPGMPGDWREGLGLGNTRMRLQQTYGTADLLRIHNGNQGGVCAEVTIPG